MLGQQAVALMHAAPSRIYLLFCTHNKNVHVMHHTDIYIYPAFANMELYLPLRPSAVCFWFWEQEYGLNYSSEDDLPSLAVDVEDQQL